MVAWTKVMIVETKQQQQQKNHTKLAEFGTGFEGQLAGLGGGLDVGVKERKQTRMTQIFDLSNWVDDCTNSWYRKGKGEEHI